MDVTALPYNRLIGLEPADPESGCLVSLPGLPQYTNHLGTVHASALLALAEAGSGACLLRQLGEASGYLPVVRRLTARFRRPANGRVSARASLEPAELQRIAAELESRGRVLVDVAVEVVDDSRTIVLSANVEWFIARAEDGP